MEEFADIEDEAGNVIGTINLTTMHVLLPNPRFMKALATKETIYLRNYGKATRTLFLPDEPTKAR